MINLNDMECLSNQGILQKYVRKSNGTIYSVKSVIVPDGAKPEHHPLVQNLEKITKYSHPNIPKYYGWASKKDEGFTEVLIFLEDSEGSLSDYLKDNRFTKDDISRLATELLDVLIFLDREAYALPSYVTPYNVLVTKDPSGRIHFKPFGSLPHDDNRRLTEEDLKYTAPEMYERLRLKRTHINVNAEKAVFYSLGILILYCGTQDLISNGRDGVDTSHFSTRNHERETEAATYSRTRLLSIYNDNKLNEMLGKFLIYSDKERADFRIWQLSQKSGSQSGPNQKKAPKEKKPVQNQRNEAYMNGGAYQQGGGGMNQGAPKKKNACKEACCNIF